MCILPEKGAHNSFTQWQMEQPNEYHQKLEWIYLQQLIDISTKKKH